MEAITAQKIRIGYYILQQVAAGRRRFPLVLMLEPLFRCNLRCKGCGKIQHPASILKQEMGIDECSAAAEECGAPVVSIAGGEPLLHSRIHRVVQAFIAQRRYVYLCTNGLLAAARMHQFTPSPYLIFNIHLDGWASRHDALVGRRGVFDQAVAAVRRLLAAGFRVTTNTTIFGDDTPRNLASFFHFLCGLGIEGITVAPAFDYADAADKSIFLDRATTVAWFRQLLEKHAASSWRFNHSPLYLDFLAGGQDYPCTPWGNPTRNLFGWQTPCYLLNDGYVETFQQLMETTNWSAYGVGRDRRCKDCMVHCGFEATAVLDMVHHPLKALRISRRRHLGGGGFHWMPEAWQRHSADTLTENS